jgi:hypothetical protein
MCIPYWIKYVWCVEKERCCLVIETPRQLREVEMPRNRLTSVLFVATPMLVAQDHELLDIVILVGKHFFSGFLSNSFLKGTAETIMIGVLRIDRPSTVLTLKEINLIPFSQVNSNYRLALDRSNRGSTRQS